MRRQRGHGGVCARFVTGKAKGRRQEDWRGRTGWRARCRDFGLPSLEREREREREEGFAQEQWRAERLW
jgi:hypothetical protein